MKFIKLTLSYISKNFLYLTLMAIIPAVFFGLTLSPFQPIEFINGYSTTPVVNFGTIFSSIITFGWLELLLTIIALALIIIFVSAILGQMEQHLRSGKLNLAALKDHVNNNILIVSANIVALFIIAFILMFALSAILFLTHLLLSGLNSSPTVFNIIIANILLSAMLILYAVIASAVFINTANMIDNGGEFRYSFSESIKLTQKNTLQLTIAILAPYVVMSIFISLFYTSNLLPVINVIGVFIFIIYYSAFAITSYFELAKLDRYDKRKKYYHK